MADKNLLSQMLESLVNDDKTKAEELFHEYVVAASREIYEGLIEAEMQDDEEDEEDLEEGSESEEDEEEMDEGFEDIAVEGDDEEGVDATDDLAGELDAGDEFGGEEETERSEEELFQDLDSIVDELQAKFDELKGIEGEEHGDEFGGADFGDEDENEGFEPEMATVREYVEKVSNGHGAEKKGAGEGALVGTGNKGQGSSTSAKSVVAGKNDMGGTAANILSSKEDAPTYAGAAGGALKGNGLADSKPKDMNTGNINVPGGNAGKTSFKKKEAGHGAEKKGEGEGKYSGTGSQSDSVTVSKQSLFRGRR